MILAGFDLQATPILPNKFLVNLPFGSGEEVQNLDSTLWKQSNSKTIYV